MPVVTEPGPPRRSWRLLDQQRQEGPVRQPQREPPGQCQQQPGLPLVPELDAGRSVEVGHGMDQTARPVPGKSAFFRGCRGERQGARGAGRCRDGVATLNAPRAADAGRLGGG